MTQKMEFTALPPHIKKIITFVNMNPGEVDVFECKTKEDLFELSLTFPFETTSMAKRTGDGPIEGYYIIGIATPNVLDLGDLNAIHRPTIAYYLMNDHDWRVYKDDIKKEVERRKKLFNETRAGWKNLKETR